MATIVGELISKKPVELKPIPDQPGYYYIPQRTEFIVKRSAGNKVVNLITRIHNYYDEPRLIKHCENDKEAILVAINDFIVQEEDTVKICLACDFNPEDVLDHLTKIVDEIYERYHQNHSILKTGISFSIKVLPTHLYFFSREEKQVIPKRNIKIDNIDIKPSTSSLNSKRTRNNIKTIIAKQLKSKL